MFPQLIGQSVLIKQISEKLKRAIEIDLPVLLLGETGTGKELCARAIHSSSQRANGPFFAINLATLPPPLAASELFGHEKGAFTDAKTQKVGAFQVADSGTLFLDEITEASTDVQACLLRAIETCKIL